jgi:hypothetical protein
LFTEAKLFGLNGIIMHRGPCAALNVRKALDSSATRLPAHIRLHAGVRRAALRIGSEQMALPPSQQQTVVGQKGD